MESRNKPASVDDSMHYGRSFASSSFYQLPSFNSRSDEPRGTTESPIDVTPKTFSDIFINPRLVASSGGMVLVKKKENHDNPPTASNNKEGTSGVAQDSTLAKLIKATWSEGSKPTLIVGNDR